MGFWRTVSILLCKDEGSAWTNGPFRFAIDYRNELQTSLAAAPSFPFLLFVAALNWVTVREKTINYTSVPSLCDYAPADHPFPLHLKMPFVNSTEKEPTLLTKRLPVRSSSSSPADRVYHTFLSWARKRSSRAWALNALHALL